MARSRPPQASDRTIAEGTVARRGVAGDANALWRYERQRRRNLLARPGPLPVSLVLDRLKPDVNVAKIFRCAEAFGAESVHLVAIGPFDPAPAKGGFKHVPARLHPDFGACLAALEAEAMQPVLLDPAAGELLDQAELPPRCAFVLGHELTGLSAEAQALATAPRLRIRQWGRVDSLNVAVAAAIALYEFGRRHAPVDPD